MLVAASALFTACGSSGGDAGAPSVHPFSDKKAATAGKAIGVPSRYVGPQGQTGQFVVHCTYSHEGTNDPIVHPRMPGMSHLHEFYGPPGTDADSTPTSLLRARTTTCDKPGDNAAYWHPALLDHGKAVQPEDLSAYYRAAPGVDPKAVRSFPFGLAMLAGDQFATKPQRGDASGWACGVQTAISDDPPVCSPTAKLHLRLTFPDCWDGEYADSEDHVSHVAYSAKGRCPKGFGVHIPQLELSIRFPISGEGHDLSLASGNIYSAHGDFLDGWKPEALAREVKACINRGVVCDLASNRQDNSLFGYNH